MNDDRFSAAHTDVLCRLLARDHLIDRLSEIVAARRVAIDTLEPIEEGAIGSEEGDLVTHRLDVAFVEDLRTRGFDDDTIAQITTAYRRAGEETTWRELFEED